MADFASLPSSSLPNPISSSEVANWGKDSNPSAVSGLSWDSPQPGTADTAGQKGAFPAGAG